MLTPAHFSICLQIINPNYLDMVSSLACVLLEYIVGGKCSDMSRNDIHMSIPHIILMESNRTQLMGVIHMYFGAEFILYTKYTRTLMK